MKGAVMKEFAKDVLVRGCAYFTGAYIFWIIASLVFGQTTSETTGSIPVFAACFLLSLLQGVWFTDKFMKKPSYPMRIFGFGVCGFIALALCAWFGEWMPMDMPEAWISFAVIYLILLVMFAIFFSWVYRKDLEKYRRALRSYQEKSE